MPSHIYIRVGKYHEGSLSNELAVKPDEEYLTQCRQQGLYPVRNNLGSVLIGAGKFEEAKKVEHRFKEAWKYADFQLTDSRIL